MACGQITLGSEADCAALPAAGTRAKAYVMNYDDIDSYTEAGGVITDITLKAGKYAYLFTGLGNSFKTSVDFARSANTGVGRYKHKNSIVIYDRTQAQKDNITSMGNGRFVVVAQFNGPSTDEDQFILLGKNTGVELTAGTILDAFANDGFFVLNMSTPEGEIENEVELPQSVWDTDRTITEAMLDALLDAS
jgi:hypothetical protein